MGSWFAAGRLPRARASLRAVATGRSQAEERTQHYRPREGSFAQEAINGPEI